MKRVVITEGEIRNMVNSAIDAMTDKMTDIEFPNDGTEFSEDDTDDSDERLNMFYDTIEELATEGILCFKKIKQMISEDEYGKANSEKFKNTLEKINKICDSLDDFIKDYGRE